MGLKSVLAACQGANIFGSLGKGSTKESLLPQERLRIASENISWFVENQLNTVIESFQCFALFLFYFICMDYINSTSKYKNFIFASMK